LSAESDEQHDGAEANGVGELSMILEGIGGSVHYDESHDGGESSRVTADGSFQIFLPNYTSRKRDRFTVAHEIGHFFLHFLLPGETRAILHSGADNKVRTGGEVLRLRRA
jgi:hypothetical protein